MDRLGAPLLIAALALLAARPVGASSHASALAREVLSACGEASVLVLGERHGESRSHALFARVVGELAGRGERLLVGLEIPADRGQDLQAALAGTTTPSFPVVDGPSYRGLLAFLGGLTKGGVVVEALDARAGEPGVRDAAMARNAERALASGRYDRVVALVGNVHALKEIPWAGGTGAAGRDRLAGRLEAQGVAVASVVQWFPEACSDRGDPSYRAAGTPEADAAVEALWRMLNTVPAPGKTAAAADGAVVWGCAAGGT